MKKLITEYQKKQIPIFKYLINKNDFLFDFNLVTNNQFVSIEKKYVINNKDFWVNIEIEDAKSISEIDCYEVWFKHHDENWRPSNEYEEIEDYPIKHSSFNNIKDLRKMVDSLNNNNINTADELMDYNNV